VRARVVLALAAVLAGACGGSDDDGPSAAPAADLDPAALTATATSVDGDQVDLAGYADRDLVVWFWAPW